MSEFSESYHLRTESQDDGVALLERAGVGGWVFPPIDGWCTVVVDRDFAGEPDPEVVAANRGVLLYYLNAEDHGWGIVLYDGTTTANTTVSSYFIEWTFDVEVQNGYDEGAMRARLTTVPPESWPEIVALLDPPATDDEMIAWLMSGPDGGNPGHRVAGLLGLPHYDWLSGPYLANDPADERAEGVLRVD